MKSVFTGRIEIVSILYFKIAMKKVVSIEQSCHTIFQAEFGSEPQKKWQRILFPFPYTATEISDSRQMSKKQKCSLDTVSGQTNRH